jgi:hypothetical protein
METIDATFFRVSNRANATVRGTQGATDEVLRGFGSVVKNADGVQETVTIDGYIV